MLDKIKNFVAENKLDIIEKGSMAIGAVIGIIVVAISMSMHPEDEPYEDEVTEE